MKLNDKEEAIKHLDTVERRQIEEGWRKVRPDFESKKKFLFSAMNHLLPATRPGVTI